MLKMAQGGSNKKVANSLVALSSAAVLAVYYGGIHQDPVLSGPIGSAIPSEETCASGYAARRFNRAAAPARARDARRARRPR
jgi:hypothetical protein